MSRDPPPLDSQTLFCNRWRQLLYLYHVLFITIIYVVLIVKNKVKRVPFCQIFFFYFDSSIVYIYGVVHVQVDDLNYPSKNSSNMK
jgi:hypothetical protein